MKPRNRSILTFDPNRPRAAWRSMPADIRAERVKDINRRLQRLDGEQLQVVQIMIAAIARRPLPISSEGGDHAA